MQDRFTRGLIAGIIAGTASFIFNFGALKLNLSTLVWADFLGFFLIGKKPEGIAEILFAVIAQFLLLGVMGIIFAFLIPLFSSKNYLLKSWIYGVSIWFLTYFITFLFKLPEIKDVPIKTAVSNGIGASLWGIALGFILNWLDNRLKV